MEQPEYDKVTQASMNGIYVKAQEMDRGHNEGPAPSFTPPGSRTDAETHASTHASTRESDGAADESVDCSTHASDSPVQGDDAETHASTHASDGS